MVDSNDRERVEEARDEIRQMMGEQELSNVVLLIFANKQDLPNVMTTTEMTEKLEVHSLTDRKWHVQAASANSGDGLYEGLDWLSEQIKKKK